MPKKSKLEKLIRTNIIGIITTKSASYRMTKLAGFKIILSIIILLFAQSVQSQNCSTLSPAFTYTLSNSGCSSPDTISFANTSSGSGLSGTTFYWNVNHTAFDTTSASTTPNSISKTSGTYTITLISITAASCIDSVTKTISIQNAISPSFTNVSDTICLGSAMLFTNSTSGSTTGKTYTWKVGNSTFSSHSDTASYVFSTSGNHVITLRIKKGNCTYTTSKNITVASGRQPIRFYNNLGIALQTVTWTRCLT
ncbi:MAG: PKD domain-containing protein, partial [Bacteroidetes bacterium]|nr:PKD domain-containing protein [Bacteroidota bacterium]